MLIDVGVPETKINVMKVPEGTGFAGRCAFTLVRKEFSMGNRYYARCVEGCRT